MSAERKVLVVDDDETVCLVAVGCLEGWPGTEVDCAHDGPSGLKRLQDTRYNLTLIDGTLSGFTGLDLAEAAVNDDVPVLMICVTLR